MPLSSSALALLQLVRDGGWSQRARVAPRIRATQSHDHARADLRANQEHMGTYRGERSVREWKDKRAGLHGCACGGDKEAEV